MEMLRALDVRGPQGSSEGSRQAMGAVAKGDTPRLLCVVCGHWITSAADRIEVAGAHEHTFANPHGFVFRIGCFGAAPGCSAVGVQTAQFSWFAGYAWRAAVCGKCGAHLGWGFAAPDHAFLGLIAGKLVDGPVGARGGKG